MLKITIAGSLPKPAWRADPKVQLFAPWMVPSERLSEAQDDAVRLALSASAANGRAAGPRTRAAARGKLQALVEGARRVRGRRASTS